jgi:UDP-glucose:(heptosyl)LPS alpha-1,3-glucosyltransferase
MKVGLVISKFDPRRGGAELWTFEFAKRLAARGHEVHVVSMAFGERTREIPFVAHRLEPTSSRLGFAAAAEARLRTLDLDVIHDQGMGWYCDLLQSHGGAWRASTEAKAMSLPRWLRPLKQATIPVLPRYRTFRQLAARQFANPRLVVLALSQMVARDFLRFHRIRPEQIRLVYNGVDTEQFSPAHRERHREAIRDRFGVRDDEAIFLFVGNDYHRKGLWPAVQATARLADEGYPARLLVVGGKPYRRCAYALGRHGAGDRLMFTGMVDDPVPYYAAADAFVLPTLYDPCSLSVLEAAASGLPCITTRLNGAGELLADGVEGYVLSDPGDVDVLTERMRSLMAPSVRRRMGDAARRLMLAHTLDHNCDQIVAIYEEIRRGRRLAA